MERAIRKYSTLAIQSQDRLLYGVSPHPLECGLGLTIGGGLVYPEVNFTLPTMSMDDGTWGEVVAHYEQMASRFCAGRLLCGRLESCWSLNFFRP